MLSKDAIRTIENWGLDHFGNMIWEWTRIPENGEQFKNDVDVFALTIQKQANEIQVAIYEVQLRGGLGDLLSTDFSESCQTTEEAMAIGEEFVERIENEYIIR